MSSKETDRLCMTRRDLLLAGGTTLALASLPGIGSDEPQQVRIKHYEKKAVVALDELKVDEPVSFQFPDDSPLSPCFLVKLGERAGGGIGPDEDIVAFSYICPHMGGPLIGKYRSEYKAMGPCPFHLTTFDLTRFGIVISGHATVSLPQIYLEIREGQIYATGIMGLIYGHNEV